MINWQISKHKPCCLAKKVHAFNIPFSYWSVCGCGNICIIKYDIAFGIVGNSNLAPCKKNINLIKQAKIDKPEIIKDLDAMSAQLVMAFTLMYALGIFNGYWI